MPATTDDPKAVLTPDDSKAVPEGAAGLSAGPVRDKSRAVLKGEIDILFDRRIPHLDQGPVRAYEARPMVSSASRSPYFALICEPYLIPRPRLASSYAGIINPCMARLVSYGPVFWPHEQGWRYCFIYENTLGQPLMKSDQQEVLGLRQDHVMKAVVKPMINVLLDLRDADIYHGNIRPWNMFDGGDRVLDKVILGEFLSTPPGSVQPALFEPVERAMCDPVARGPGTFQDDLYALGVSLTLILRKKNPLEGFSEENIVREKIENGSYVALTGKERFTGPMLELLRGLLYDDRDQRWTLDEVMAWMDGQHMSPKQGSRRKKASRPIAFNAERYYREDLLAMDLNKNQSEAVQIIDGGHLDQWISRSLEDNTIRNRLEQAIETAQEQGRGPGYWDRLLSRVSIALHPDAPLRYKGLNLNAEGISAALASAFVLKKDLQPYGEIISQNLVMYWVSAQTSPGIDVGSLASRFDACRAFLRQANMGYGLERCLYHINPEVPCLSERLRKYYVTNPEDLMYALEDMAETADRTELLIDRHIAAFLSVRDRKVIDAYWSDLNSTEYHKKVIGNLKVLATIQSRARMEPLPGLARRVADLLEPVYERYHDRELRRNLKEKIESIKSSGNLSRMAGIFENSETLQKDMGNFRQAMAEYQELSSEKKKIEAKMADSKNFGMETGREVAAIFSGLLAALIILGLGFLFFIRKEPF